MRTWVGFSSLFQPRQENKFLLSESPPDESALLSLSDPSSARRLRKGSDGITGSSESLSL